MYNTYECVCNKVCTCINLCICCVCTAHAKGLNGAFDRPKGVYWTADWHCIDVYTNTYIYIYVCTYVYTYKYIYEETH